MNLSSFYHIYLCSKDEKRFPRKSKKIQLSGHNIANLGKKKIIWPKKFNPNQISPKNFMILKESINIQNVLIVDRLKGIKKAASVVGHINRSGISFLRGKTPIKKAQQFPDMSYVYSKVEGMESKTVHTLGPERFLKPPQHEKYIWSESIGLVSIVAHYVGMNVFAVGTESDSQRKELIEKILKNR